MAKRGRLKCIADICWLSAYAGSNPSLRITEQSFAERSSALVAPQGCETLFDSLRMVEGMVNSPRTSKGNSDRNHSDSARWLKRAQAHRSYVASLLSIGELHCGSLA